MTEGVQHAAGVQIHIRDARASDAAAIATIYNEGIRGRGATFEKKERSPEDVVSPQERCFGDLVGSRA